MRKAERSLALAVLAVLGGCSLAPTYHVPEVATPEHFKEAGPWTVATPEDTLARGNWWTLYNDETLNGLEDELVKNSPDLAAAYARYQQAAAYGDQLNAALYPNVTGIAQTTRNRQSDNRPLRGPSQPNVYDANTVGIVADYELDLWGRIHNQVAAGRALEQASADDLASAQLSLQARLAGSYVNLRGLDLLIKLLSDTVEAYQRALVLTQTLHDGGLVSGLDVSRAQTQLSSARAEVTDTLAQRALYEHTIAVLIGRPASTFQIASSTKTLALPDVPASVPSALLQRRPDIAQAERRTAAANAQIGVARAAFYPDISLSALFGYQNTGMGPLLSAPNAMWSIGPTLFQTIFDAGYLDARLAQARASLDEAGAQYRSVVLAAFKDVEDNLALIYQYQLEFGDRTDAAQAANHTLELALSQYRDGGVSYLEVVDSQTAALAADRRVLDLQTRRLQASVDLIRALGGGWSTDSPIPGPPGPGTGGMTPSSDQGQNQKQPRRENTDLASAPVR